MTPERELDHSYWEFIEHKIVLSNSLCHSNSPQHLIPPVCSLMKRPLPLLSISGLRTYQDYAGEAVTGDKLVKRGGCCSRSGKTKSSVQKQSFCLHHLLTHVGFYFQMVGWGTFKLSGSYCMQSDKLQYSSSHYVRPVSRKSHHARWLKWESMEQPITSQPMLRNSSALSLKATISVGHTNVKSRG